MFTAMGKLYVEDKIDTIQTVIYQIKVLIESEMMTWTTRVCLDLYVYI